jgi:hypothetical protein
MPSKKKNFGHLVQLSIRSTQRVGFVKNGLFWRILKKIMSISIVSTKGKLPYVIQPSTFGYPLVPIEFPLCVLFLSL